MKTENLASSTVSKSQLNTSTAKACYSFAKAPRSPKKDNIK